MQQLKRKIKVEKGFKNEKGIKEKEDIKEEKDIKREKDIKEEKCIKKEKGIKEKEDIKEEKDIKEINVSFTYTPFTVISQGDINKFAQIEEEMEIRDKKEIEIDNTKNDLESLIFSTLSELNSVKINDDSEQKEINEIKEKVNEIFMWFSENEFERLQIKNFRHHESNQSFKFAQKIS